MGCPCKDPKTGEIKDVPAKTKEMVYRAQMPSIKKAILNDKKGKPPVVKMCRGGKSK